MARPRGNYQVTEARRESILVSAFNVFAKSGFRGGSLKQVADQVGMTEAGILHHFKSKSALLISVLEYRDANSQNTFLPMNTTVSGAEFIEHWLGLIRYNMDNPGIVELFCILSAEATSEDHPAHSYFKDRYKSVTALTTSYFDILRYEDMLRNGLESVDLAKTLIALTDGLQVQWLLDPSWDMLESHRAFFRGILRPEFEHIVAIQDARDYNMVAGR
jgi:AcrR family transcriptional regulator